MATPQSGSCRWIGKDPGVAFSQKIEVTRRGESEESPSLSSLHSLVLSLFLLHILDLVVFLLCFLFCFWKIFLFCLLSVKDCCFGRIDLLALLLFLVANSWGGEKVGRVSLSMKDCGAASRAAKSPLRLLFWKTWGIFSFQSANISALFLFSRFSQFCSPRLLLVERQWVLGSEMSSPSWNC